MKACCPTCGHVAELMQFVRERDAHEFKALALRWPAPLADPLMRYLSLFEPPQRAMGWKRATTLVRQLVSDIERGYIERAGRTWAAPHDAWKAALQTIVNKRDTLTLPLRDHAYLYEILRRGANRTEAQAEEKVEKQRRQRRHQARPTTTGGPELPERTLPPGGSLTAALKQMREATQSPTTNSTTED